MRRLVILISAATAAAVAQAQYNIDWYTIDGGGGTSTGGVYAVTGTIGQPDAGTMAGGSYVVEGGFWSIIAVQTQGAPHLSITRTNGGVFISWPAADASGWVLDQAPSVQSSGTSWMPVVNPYSTNAGVIGITVPAADAMRYYRLRKQ